MDAGELALWQAYYRVEPFGEWRADLRVASFAAAYINGKVGPDDDRVRVQDCMAWDYGRTAVAQTPGEVEAAIDAAFGPLVGREPEGGR